MSVCGQKTGADVNWCGLILALMLIQEMDSGILRFKHDERATNG